MSKYSVAIIGLGIMGRRMLTAMTAHDRFHVAGVWDPDAAQFDAARAAGLPVTAADDAAALITAETTDLVYIACPPAHHAGYAQAAMAAGKAVLCEKPLGVDLAESQALVAAAAASGCVNAVNFSQASSPALTTIQ
ncbi:MAG: Gfo/Idh/MocA family protein, partial [Thalassobaculaceae bacterium]